MNNKQHTIVYVMRHVDATGNIKIPYKKIGITGSGNATLSGRLKQLRPNDAKSPIQIQCVIAWKHNEASEIEEDLHLMLKGQNALGEWFIDECGSLVEGLKGLMKKMGAEEIALEDSNDEYTKSVMKKEHDLNQKLLNEIIALLSKKLERTSIRQDGPTIKGDDSELTFYVNPTIRGSHNLYIGRSDQVFEQLKSFLDKKRFNCKQSGSEAKVSDISVQEIADIINYAEAEFKAYLEEDSKK